MGELSYRSLILSLAIILAFALAVSPLDSRQSFSSSELEEKLANGEVLVNLSEKAEAKFVVGRIVIGESPQKVWPVVANPFEFQGKIFPRLKEVDVILDRKELSILRCAIDVGFFLPQLNYVVQSRYTTGSLIEFKRLSGLPKDFAGSWQIAPYANGSKSEVTYCLYIDPGFMIPPWIVRQGIKAELPQTLVALRSRVEELSRCDVRRQARTIEAAGMIDEANECYSMPFYQRSP